MTPYQVTVLNIVLMLASLGAAFIVPFEVFLFSYAVLGPLHCLTELSWLHDRDYFLPARRLALPIVALTVVVTLTSGIVFEAKAGSLAWLASQWGPELRMGALGISLFYVVAKTLRGRRVGLFVTSAALILVHFLNQNWKASGGPGAGYTEYEIFSLVFLTTIVHVFVFTGAFVLLGALRNQSRSEQVFTSSLGTTMARLIAYAYTYRYLNWFSKTSVIRWHEVPRLRLIFVVVIWVASLVVYNWNYLVGLDVLFFLSMLHVFLEFPLNWRSFMDIAAEIRMRISPICS